MIKNFCKILFVRITFTGDTIVCILIFIYYTLSTELCIIHRINNPKKLVKDVFYLNHIRKKVEKVYEKKCIYSICILYRENIIFFSI